MRLLTHNSLRCHAKDVTNGYPLNLIIEEMEIEEADYNEEFMRHILPSLNWSGVRLVGKIIGLDGLPEEFENDLLNDDEFLRAMHNLLIEIHIIKGTLVCPESGRKFIIEDGIPIMRLSNLLFIFVILLLNSSDCRKVKNSFVCLWK